MSDPGQPSVASTPGGATRIRLAPVAVLAVIVAALTGLLFAVPAASASPLVGARNAVGVIVQPAGQVVGLHEPKLPGESRQRAPGYDQIVVGSCVAPEIAAGAAPETAANAGAGSAMGDMLAQEIHCGTDCSEIAEDLYNAAGKQGEILRVEPAKPGLNLSITEDGQQVNYMYHEVYSDGRYRAASVACGESQK